MADTQTIPETTPDGPSRRARITTLVLVVLVGAMLVGAVALFAAGRFGIGDGWDVEPGLEASVTIESGATARSIYATLEEAGVARARELEEAAQELRVEGGLKAGSYVFITDMDATEAIRQLVSGPNAGPGKDFTVVEGWTVDRIVAELAARTDRPVDDVAAILTSGAVTSPYLPPIGGAVDALNRWEGLLYPATYPIGTDPDPAALLGAMADEMTARLDALDAVRLDALGISRYEALVIGSLIEREAGTDAERPTIASVIHNRLGVPMRLQIDATVVYALGGVDGRVTAADLEVDSPYNTYRVDGLPPTPIGTVSAASLAAAVAPESTTYLFYVLGSPDGSHLFATTYEEHQANIEIAREAGMRP